MNENVIEEIEIKIEYFESCEADPLSDKNYDKTTVDEFSETETSEIVSFKPSPEDKTWHKQIDGVGRYVCKFCELTYSTVQTLRYHINFKHISEANNLRNSILKNKRNKKFKCHICKKRFQLLTELEGHVKEQHKIEDLEISCSHCDATFTSQNCLINHLYLIHNIQKKKIFVCKICGYRTFKSSHYNQHSNTHNKEKNLNCKFCDYQTYHLSNLKIHERLHSNEKPYVCEYENCGYRAPSKAALRSHQLKHDREKNFLFCDKCGYKTVYSQTLRKHIDSHLRNSIKTIL